MDFKILTHSGAPALSDFRRQLLSKRIGVLDVRAHFVHYVVYQENHQELDVETLEQLLTYDEVPQEGPIQVYPQRYGIFQNFRTKYISRSSYCHRYFPLAP